MKKEYIAPKMDSIEVKMSTQILQSSGGAGINPSVDPMDEVED